MPAFPLTISRAWTVTFAGLRFVSRVGIGLLGIYWLVGGAISAVTAPFVGAWSATAGAVLFAFIGWVLAYGAFKRWPWETSSAPSQQADTR